MHETFFADRLFKLISNKSIDQIDYYEYNLNTSVKIASIIFEKVTEKF